MSACVFSKFERVTDYPDAILPTRATSESAGYDFYVAEDIIIPAYNEQRIKLANDIFSSIDKDLGDSIDIVVKAYSKATSTKALLVLIVSIVFFIALLFLINWSLFKWMLVVGIRRR